MAAARKLMTTVSTKGQVILPKAIRDQLKWGAGTRLEVEETPEGVLLRPTRLFPETRMEDVFGALGYSGPPKTLDEMDAAIMAEARRQYEGD